MDREILFRGKRVDNGEWIEGSLVKADGRINNGKCYMLSAASDFSCGDNGNRVRIGCFVGVYPATVGQYTGLKDKNGKRIFEGDICKFRKWSGGEMCWIGKVHFENQVFLISGNPNDECDSTFTFVMSRFIPESIEVIGNIHDNPDLLQ